LGRPKFKEPAFGHHILPSSPGRKQRAKEHKDGKKEEGSKFNL
jgi:hypothetical protein